MHELWICKNILEIIGQNVQTMNCNRIKKIVLEIGELAAIEKEALFFGFKVASEGSVAENAVLHIIDIPGEAFCESCQKLVPLRQYYDACQSCGNHALKVIHGEELRVQSMVIE